MDLTNKDYEKIIAYVEKKQKILEKTEQDKLIEVENYIYNYDDNYQKVKIGLYDLLENSNDYNGKYKKILINILKNINKEFALLSQNKQNNQPEDYDRIKGYISLCNILIGEDITFFDSLKRLDLIEIKEMFDEFLREDNSYVR